MLTYTAFLKKRANRMHDLLTNLNGGLEMYSSAQTGFHGVLESYVHLVTEINSYKRTGNADAKEWSEYMEKRVR